MKWFQICIFFQELHDFKMELEADNRGITEMLERHSLELDQPAESNHKENRIPKKAVSSNLLNRNLPFFYLKKSIRILFIL